LPRAASTRYDRQVEPNVAPVIVGSNYFIMAVELRCPECRAKLRLKVNPEPDSEIECPKCQHVFACDENIVHAGSADDEAPRPKQAAVDKPPSGEEAKKTSSESAKPFKRKRRKAKKRKTKPIVIVGIVVGALMIIGTAAGVLIWFFTKKSASQEMMTYLPADCDEVSGINVGHLQKYPDFYTNCEQMFSGRTFKAAADALAKTMGQQTKDVLEYVVQGNGISNGVPVEATVLRTKEDFDPAVLSKLPGAKESTADGIKYYTIPNIPDLGYTSPRVFAPTNRIAVFCPGTVPDAVFRAMLKGNKDNLDATSYYRSGALGKQVIRGTAWKFMLYGRSVTKLSAPTPQGGGGGGGFGGGDAGGIATGGSESDEDAIRREIAGILSSAQGCGVKASVGSREVRGEFIVLYKDSTTASEMLKKWNERDWIKDQEKDPPRWWKTLANKSGGGKTAANVLRDGLSFRSSGETFIVRTRMETNLLKNGVSALVSLFLGQQSGGPPPGGIPGGPPGGFPGGGPGGPGAPGRPPGG